MRITPREKKRMDKFCQFASSDRIETVIQYSNGSYGVVSVGDYQQMRDHGDVKLELICRKCGEAVQILEGHNEEDSTVCSTCNGQ